MTGMIISRTVDSHQGTTLTYRPHLLGQPNPFPLESINQFDRPGPLSYKEGVLYSRSLNTIDNGTRL